jgi:hypothetical protein
MVIILSDFCHHIVDLTRSIAFCILFLMVIMYLVLLLLLS